MPVLFFYQRCIDLSGFCEQIAIGALNADRFIAGDSQHIGIRVLLEPCQRLVEGRRGGESGLPRGGLAPAVGGLRGADRRALRVGRSRGRGLSGSLRDDGPAALEWAARYLERVDSLPVLAQVAPGEIRARLPARAPESGEPFSAVLRDPEFLVEAGNLRIDVNPQAGEDIQRIVEALHAAPRHVVERLKQIVEP